MELIVIGRDRLKITLTPPDMTHYALSNERLDCVDEETRRAFRHVFADARERIGFETEGQRLFVQLYASREGGCEIFVTKLGETEDVLPPERRKALTTPEEALLRRLSAVRETDGTQTTPAPLVSPAPRERTVAVILPDLTALLTVCRRLRSVGYAGDSRAYIKEGSPEPAPAYLFLKIPDGVMRRRLPDHFAFLCEYGQTVEPHALSLYVNERGRVICEEHAVERLGVL